MTAASAPELAVILVNWRQPDFTIECLESLLRSPLPMRVIVCDNASGDGSMDRLRAWAEGREAYRAPDGPLARLTTPALPKPLDCRYFSADEAAADTAPLALLSLIDTGANLGFAGGNNVGIRRALRESSITHIWLLNNDTVVEPDAAAALLAELKHDSSIGMAGTTIRHYHHPEKNQLLNGSRFNFWSGRGVPLHGDSPAGHPVAREQVIADTDFVCGASLGVSRAFVETVGLMSEDYFLYYEEIDWAVRGQDRFRTGFAPDAIVYHRHGGSIGSSRDAARRSTLSEYYLARNALLFARKYFPLRLPFFYLYWSILALRRRLKGQKANAAAILRALRGLPL